MAILLLATMLPAATGQDTIASPPVEFRAVFFGNDEKANTDKLNELAAEGWRYVGPLGNGMVAFQRPLPGTTTVNFDALDASMNPGVGLGGEATSKYLAKFGIQITAVTQGSQVEILDTRKLYEGKAAVASSFPNILTQTGVNKPISFTLTFATPLDSFGFTRPKLLTSPTGIIHPAWNAEAFDATGKRLDSVGEKMIRSFKDVPAAAFTLKGPGIRSIRFDSDNGGVAAFSGVLLDDFVLKRTRVDKK
jgi:hypothetical protein